MTNSPEEQRWSLQGQLVGQWAAELRSTWRKAQVEGDTRKCIVELIEVTSIDRNGEEALSEIMSHGAEFIASDVYTKHLLQNLRSELERSRVKEKQDDVATDHEIERDRLGAKQVNHSLLAPSSIGISGFEAAAVNAPEYDLVVIGSGPAGQKGAIAAAKARKSVAVIDRIGMIGGVSVHTGTIPSKTVREAIFQLSGLAVSALYGAGSRGRVEISVENVSSRVKAIVARETE